MNFGKALEALKSGKTVKRKSWESGNFIYLNNGNIAINDMNTYQTEIQNIDISLFNKGDTGTCLRLPNLNLKSEDTTLTGWAASQHDMLAEDWEII